MYVQHEFVTSVGQTLGKSPIHTCLSGCGGVTGKHNFAALESLHNSAALLHVIIIYLAGIQLAQCSVGIEQVESHPYIVHLQ